MVSIKVDGVEFELEKGDYVYYDSGEKGNMCLYLDWRRLTDEYRVLFGSVEKAIRGLFESQLVVGRRLMIDIPENEEEDIALLATPQLQ